MYTRTQGKMQDGLWCSCGDKFRHVDEQRDGDTMTDHYFCDGCETWCAVSWDARTGEVTAVSYELDSAYSEDEFDDLHYS